MINQQIMVYSVPRTGSTLIWQCLTKIFTKVLKSHRNRIWDYFSGRQNVYRKKHKERSLIIPVRALLQKGSLMDSFLSQWRNDNWQYGGPLSRMVMCSVWGRRGYPLRVPPRSGQKYCGWTRKNDESQSI